MDKSQFARIGGEALVEAAVNRFYDKFFDHPEIEHFFEGIPVEQQQRKLRHFFTYTLGGSDLTSLTVLARIHQPLLQKGLKISHVDLWISMMSETLRELSVPDVLIEDVTDCAEKIKQLLFPSASVEPVYEQL